RQSSLLPPPAAPLFPYTTLFRSCIGVGGGDRRRLALVAGDAHLRVERHGPEQVKVHVLREDGTAAVPEDVDVFAAVRAVHARHVLDDAEKRCAYALEHANRASYVAGRDVLWC